MNQNIEGRRTEDANERLDDDGAPARSHPDGRRQQLRVLVGKVERALPTDATLKLAWGDLVTALALGPSPATRACPRCGELVMSAATRCGHCWLTLAS